MSALVNTAIYNILKSQDGTALTNFYDALKWTDPKNSVESLRVFHLQAPTDVPKPYIVYNRIDAEHEKHLLGDSGLAKAQYVFDCYNTNPYNPAVIAELLRLAINALINKTETITGVNFRSIFIDNDPDNVIFPTNNSQKGSYSEAAAYDFTYSQPKANVT